MKISDRGILVCIYYEYLNMGKIKKELWEMEEYFKICNNNCIFFLVIIEVLKF